MTPKAQRLVDLLTETGWTIRTHQTDPSESGGYVVGVSGTKDALTLARSDIHLMVYVHGELHERFLGGTYRSIAGRDRRISTWRQARVWAEMP